jgi:hypothetical protein
MGGDGPDGRTTIRQDERLFNSFGDFAGVDQSGAGVAGAHAIRIEGGRSAGEEANGPRFYLGLSGQEAHHQAQ